MKIMKGVALMLDKEALKHVAKLARIEIEGSEEEAVIQKISNILSYVDKLQELDTDGVEITYHPIEVKNVFREDEVKPSLDREKALQNAPSKEVGCFRVPKVLD